MTFTDSSSNSNNATGAYDGDGIGGPFPSMTTTNVQAGDGLSEGMTTANLVTSDLTRSIPYSSYSMVFDGAADYVGCGAISELVSSTNFSLSGWFYFNASAATGKTFYSYGGDTGTDQYSMTVQTFSGGNILFIIADATTDAGNNYIKTNLTTPLTTGEWYNIVCTYDGSQAGDTDKAKVYVNGVEATYGTGAGTIPATTSASTGPFNICLLYTSPSPRDRQKSRMPSSA